MTQSKKKFSLPPISCLLSDEHWTETPVGIASFIIVVMIFVYSISVLSEINKALNKHSELNEDEFRRLYKISRFTLQNYYGLFIAILLISGCALFSLIWTVLPQEIRCHLVNNYSVVIFTMFILIVSSMVMHDISSKDFSSSFSNILNVIVLILSILSLLYYIYSAYEQMK
jgi:hypothetical protein